jgi:hypothetical protein
MCRVVNKHRDAFDIYIGRGSPWGNPYRMKEDTIEERRRVIVAYGLYLMNKPELIHQAASLYGLKLGCFCHPKPCHGDLLECVVLWSYIQQMTIRDQVPEFQKDLETHPWWPWVRKHLRPEHAAWLPPGEYGDLGTLSDIPPSQRY